jgi:predicted permease
MANFLFILCLAGLLTLLFYWSFRHLPREQWQILGAVSVFPKRNMIG